MNDSRCVSLFSRLEENCNSLLSNKITERKVNCFKNTFPKNKNKNKTEISSLKLKEKFRKSC
jgi:hypothetical protein